MEVEVVYYGGDGDLDNVTKLEELDTEEGLYKFHVEGEDPHAADNATITGLYAEDEPLSAVIVWEGGSGVVENVEYIGQLPNDPSTLEVHSASGDVSETYENATVTHAVEGSEFDDDAFDDDPVLWEPYNACPFCQAIRFVESATVRRAVETDEHGFDTEELEVQDLIYVDCGDCGERLFGE